MRSSSPITVRGRSGLANQPIVEPLVARARAEQLDHALQGVGDVEGREARSSSLPASILEKSSTSSMSDSSVLAEVEMARA